MFTDCCLGARGHHEYLTCNISFTSQVKSQEKTVMMVMAVVVVVMVMIPISQKSL